MYNLRETNNFFIGQIYPNIAKFAFFPINGLNKIINDKNSNSLKIVLAIVLSLILAVETILTCAIALCLTLISALLHGLVLPTAAIAEVCSNHL